MRKLTLLLCFVSFLTNGQNITVDSGKSFTIEKTGSVTISGNFSNSGTFTLNSDSDEFSSIIIGGTVTGNISYNRYVNTVGTNKWDLIGSPVSGQSINSFVTANSSTLATNGSTKAIGYYDNADNTWTNYTTSTIDGAGNFPLGKGFQMGTIANGTGILSFTGSPAASNQTQAIINNDAANSGAGTRWNLVANPFPSYIQGNANAHATNNFLTVNSDKLDDSYEAIYGYDADGTGYTIYNNISGALLLSPGQGFMIASDNTNSDNISFTTDMRTIVGGDDFITSSRAMQDSYELILKLYDVDTEIDNTRFYFKEGLNLGLDPKKIFIGGAFYIKTFKNVENINNGLNQKAEWNKSYNQINFEDVRSNFNFYWDSIANAPYAYDSINKIFATFDDHKSIKLKSKYALENNLGGIMFWQLMNDKKQNGLLKTMVNEIKTIKD